MVLCEKVCRVLLNLTVHAERGGEEDRDTGLMSITLEDFLLKTTLDKVVTRQLDVFKRGKVFERDRLEK